MFASQIQVSFPSQLEETDPLCSFGRLGAGSEGFVICMAENLALVRPRQAP